MNFPCLFLQPYTINSAKVIFLNQRAQSRSCKASGNSCFTCDRVLQNPFNFCSLSCKVHLLFLFFTHPTPVEKKLEADSKFKFDEFSYIDTFQE